MKSTKKSAKGHKYRKYKNLQKKFAKACNYRKKSTKKSARAFKYGIYKKSTKGHKFSKSTKKSAKACN